MVLVYLRHWASKWRCQKKPWLRHWRRQYSDEHPGTVYRVANELPVLVVNLNNRYLGMVKQGRT